MTKLNNGKYVTYRDINKKQWFDNFQKEIKKPAFINKYGSLKPITDWLEEKRYTSIAHVISWAFTWNETKQGYEYWIDIKNDIQNTMYCRGKVKDSLAKIIEDM